MSGGNRFFASHGHSRAGKRSPTYRSWVAMKQRCLNPVTFEYRRYGKLGVKVCDRWLNFEAFLEDMGERPTPKHTLDRKNPYLGYAPENCEWSTSKEQANNRRNNTILTYKGGRYTQAQLLDSRFPPWPSREHAVAKVRFLRRLARGWSVEEALDTPPPGKGRKDSRV